jgi:ketosteroid isomerase-like protein
MNKHILCTLALVLLLVSCSQEPGFVKKVPLMLAACNQHDVTKQLSYYADDAVFAIAGYTPAAGKAVLRNIFACDSVLNYKLTLGDYIIRGDTVYFNSCTESNDFYRLAGVPEVRFMLGAKVIFRKGLIQRFDLPLVVTEDIKALDKFSAGFAAWLKAKHPEIVKELMASMDLPNHTVAAGQSWMKYATEYLASKK